MRHPIVIVPACMHSKGTHPAHTVQTTYIDAVVQGAGCVPLIVPALGGQADINAVLSAADGVMLTVDNAVSMKLFHAFGLACHSYQERIP